MALAQAVISFDASDYASVDFDARRTKVWATNNVEGGTVIDTVGEHIFLGSGTGTVEADGSGSISVPVPGTGSNPETWQTTIHFDYPDRNATRGRGTRSFGPYTITESADLSSLVTEIPLSGGTTIVGGSSSLIVVAGGTVNLDNAQPDGFLVGYKVTATTEIEGTSFPAGSYIFERDSDVYGGWTYRTLDTGAQVVAPPDAVAPTAGTLAGSAITATGFTLTASGAADETALHAAPYSFSTDNGSTWSAYQSSAVYTATGLASGTGFQCKHRVRDAGGNVTVGSAVTVTTTAVLTVDFLDTFTRANGALSTATTPNTGGAWAGSTATMNITSNALVGTGSNTVYASRGGTPARELTYSVVTDAVSTIIVTAWASSAGALNGPKLAILTNGQVSFQGITGGSVTYNVTGGTNPFTPTGYLSYGAHTVKVVTNADGTCHAYIDGTLVISALYSTALTERYVAVTLKGTIDDIQVKA